MNDEKEEKQPLAPEAAREAGVKDPEAEKPAETLENITEEVNKGVKIVEGQGEEYVKALGAHGASQKETGEFKTGEKKIEQSAEEAKEEYENSFRTPGDIESEIRATENQEDYNSSKIIIKNNSMENGEALSPNLTQEEISQELVKINEKIENGLKTGMSIEETDELKKQREKLLKLLPEYQEAGGLSDEKEESEEAANLSEEDLNKETKTQENRPFIAENKDLSEKELSEFEKIIKNVEAELEFLKISTYTQEKKMDSIDQQLAILGEILPKFNKAKVNELSLFRKANGLNERLLNLKKEPWLLGS